MTACYRRCATKIQWRCTRPVQTYCSYSRTLIQDLGRHLCCSPGNGNSHPCHGKEQPAFLSNDWSHNQEKPSRVITNVAKRHDEPTHFEQQQTVCEWGARKSSSCQKIVTLPLLRLYKESMPLCPNVEDTFNFISWGQVREPETTAERNDCRKLSGPASGDERSHL